MNDRPAFNKDYIIERGRLYQSYMQGGAFAEARTLKVRVLTEYARAACSPRNKMALRLWAHTILKYFDDGINGDNS